MKFKVFIIQAALIFATGCASFNSGDVVISRADLRRMLDEKGVKPASDIQVAWRNFPYKNPTDTIGEGAIDSPKPKPAPVPLSDLIWLKENARNIFSEAGLYDALTGSGTIKITLTSYGRWTYGGISRTFMVDTPLVFILPSTLQVNHQLVVDYDELSGRAKAEEIGRTNTTFHALLFPLYPLFSPGAKEHSLLKNMLWRSATDIYIKAKRANIPAAPAEAPEAAPQPAQVRPAETQKALSPAPEETPDD